MGAPCTHMFQADIYTRIQSLHGLIAQKQSALADKTHRLAQCRKATKDNVMMVTELQSWADRTAPAIETRHEGHDAQSSALTSKMKKLQAGARVYKRPQTRVQARRRLLASRVFEQLCTITQLASSNKDDQQMYTLKTSRITINDNQLSQACAHVLDQMIDSSPTSTTARAHAVWCIAGVLCRCLLLITDTCAPFSQSPTELMLLDTQPAAVALASVRKHQANVAAVM